MATVSSGNTNKYLRGFRLEVYQTPTESGMYTSGKSGSIIRTMPIDTEGNTSEQDYNLHGFTAFGKYQLNSATTNAINPFGYNGEVTDTDAGTDLIYLRNRYYDPEIGRFLTVDPAMDGTNWYAYCNNDPVNFVDPFGLTWSLFDSFLPEWAQNKIELLTEQYYSVGNSLNEQGGFMKDDIHDQAVDLRMQFLDSKWLKYASIDITDAGITEQNYEQYAYESNMTYTQMVFEYAMVLQDMSNQGGEMPRDNNGHIKKWFLDLIGGTIAPNSNFKNAINDYNNNPNNWKLTNEDIQNSSNIRNKGGTSIEQEYTNINTGQKLYKHTLKKADGSLFEEPHFRPYPKQIK